MANSGIKQCPYCAEDIKAAAIVCKHCGRELPGYKKKLIFEDTKIYPQTQSTRESDDLSIGPDVLEDIENPWNIWNILYAVGRKFDILTFLKPLTGLLKYFNPVFLYNPKKPAGRLLFVWGFFFYPLITLLGYQIFFLLFVITRNIPTSIIDNIGFIAGIVQLSLPLLIIVRRLKDIGKSWETLFWGFFPLVNIIFLFWLLIEPGIQKEEKQENDTELKNTSE